MLEVFTVVSVTSVTLSVQIIHWASKFYGSTVMLSSSVGYHFTQLQRQVALRFQSIDCLSVHSSFNYENTRSNSRHLLFYSYYSCIYRSSNSANSGLKIPIQRLCSPSYCTCNLIIFWYIQCTLWRGGKCTDNWKNTEYPKHILYWETKKKMNSLCN
jgi:hypothetical protein